MSSTAEEVLDGGSAAVYKDRCEIGAEGIAAREKALETFDFRLASLADEYDVVIIERLASALLPSVDES